VPLTPFQKRKLARMFAVLDIDRDGYLDRDDYVARVQRLAEVCGWAEDAPEYVRSLGFANDEWESLAESADGDGDGRVSLEEYLQYGDDFLDDRQAVQSYARGDAQLLFDAMDSDGDGRITVAEYRRYLEVCGADASGADSFFAHADLDEDGRISRREMAHAIEEFLLSEDPRAGGNFLFGPVNHDTAMGG
jgi:Ca2+-binding EF-hand superfamily protein